MINITKAVKMKKRKKMKRKMIKKAGFNLAKKE